MNGSGPVKPFVLAAAAAVLFGVGGILACGRADPVACTPWTGWLAYKSAFLNPDGRVVAGPNSASLSEAQAYALFFALVADDRQAFEQILRWTEDNLAGGDLTARLPAWHWGKRDDDSWGVLDENAASDADLWMAYALNESARLWDLPQHKALSALLAQRILHEETAEIPSLGLALLPGPSGFVHEGPRWRLNPSYMPIQVLRRLHAANPAAGWDRIADSAMRIIAGSAPRGFAPDWIGYSAAQGFIPDTQTGAVGSYDAIRVYLWAGLLSEHDSARMALLATLRPMADRVSTRGLPPEKVDTVSGETRGDGPAGFSAALIPFLQVAGRGEAALSQSRRVLARSGRPTEPGYFDQSLALFGTGWKDGRFRFGPDGALQPSWHSLCPAKA